MSIDSTGIHEHNKPNSSGFEAPSEAAYLKAHENRKLSSSPGKVSREKRPDNAELQPVSASSK